MSDQDEIALRSAALGHACDLHLGTVEATIDAAEKYLRFLVGAPAPKPVLLKDVSAG